MTGSLLALAGTALTIGVTHTVLGPDHYLPFVALSASRGWSRTRTLVITGLCGVGHVLGSVVLGAVGLLAGVVLGKLEAFEAVRGDLAATLLLAFGVAYMLWGLWRYWRPAGHHHALLHRAGITHAHPHAHELGEEAAAGFVQLGVGRCYASPFRFGTGFVEFSHGRLALPVPAVANLTLGCPSERTTVPSELTTPTGAAIVTTLVAPEDFSPRQALAFKSVGQGLGSRTLPDRPNMLRLFIGEQGADQPAADEVVALECNLDDMQPEYFDFLIEKLFAAGALDVWLSPAQMKKNRPGVCLHALAREADLGELARLVFLHSSGIGLRWQRMQRLVLERQIQKVDTPWGELSVKAVSLPGGGVRRKPEYDELRALAERSGLPLLELARRVDALLNG